MSFVLIKIAPEESLCDARNMEWFLPSKCGCSRKLLRRFINCSVLGTNLVNLTDFFHASRNVFISVGVEYSFIVVFSPIRIHLLVSFLNLKGLVRLRCRVLVG